MNKLSLRPGHKAEKARRQNFAPLGLSTSGLATEQPTGQLSPVPGTLASPFATDIGTPKLHQHQVARREEQSNAAISPKLWHRNKLILSLLLAVATLSAQDARQIINEVQKRARTKSQKYEGTLEVIDQKNKISTKRWEYARLGAFGESKSVLRFTSPPEVKGVALLVHNHPDRSSDQWMWRPAIERDQRIALQDRSTRFFGTDFSYEDLEERDADQYDFKLLGEETIDGAPCWKLESRPREKKVSQYLYSHLWIRKDHYVYAQIEAFAKAGLARRIRYSDVQNIQGFWTPKVVEVTDAVKKSRTVLKFEKLQYDQPIDPGLFTLQALRRAS